MSLVAGGAIAGLLILIVWLAFYSDEEEERKEQDKWIRENWPRKEEES